MLLPQLRKQQAPHRKVGADGQHPEQRGEVDELSGGIETLSEVHDGRHAGQLRERSGRETLDRQGHENVAAGVPHMR